jgi:hypothetical protein
MNFECLHEGGIQAFCYVLVDTKMKDSVRAGEDMARSMQFYY